MTTDNFQEKLTALLRQRKALNDTIVQLHAAGDTAAMAPLIEKLNAIDAQVRALAEERMSQ